MDVFVISLMAHYITTAPWLEDCGNHKFRKKAVHSVFDVLASVCWTADETPWKNIELKAPEIFFLRNKTSERFDNVPQ